MQIPNLLTPDEVIKRLLVAVFGPSATIVALFVLANWVWSWYVQYKTGVKYTRIGIDAARRLTGRLFELGSVGTCLGFVISVVVLALQAIWLGLAYLIGNGLSWFFIGGRSGMRNGPDWKAFFAGLRWDWVSGVYVAGAAVALFLAYQAAFNTDRQERASRAMTILTAPVMLIGGLSGLGAVLAGVVSVLYMISHQHDAFVKDFGLKTLALLVIALAYIVASRTIGGSPGLIARVWRPTRKRDSEPDSYGAYRSSRWP
jgi:hypothetical protein